jgi:hypothetical protein
VGLSIAVAPAIVIAAGRYLGSEDAVLVASRFLFMVALPLAAVLIVMGILEKPVRRAVSATELPRRALSLHFKHVIGRVVEIQKFKPEHSLLSYKRTWLVLSAFFSAAVAYRYRQLASPWLSFCVILVPSVAITTRMAADIIVEGADLLALRGGILVFAGAGVCVFSVYFGRDPGFAFIIPLIALAIGLVGLVLIFFGTQSLRRSASRYSRLRTLVCVMPTIVYLGYQLEGARAEHLATLKKWTDQEHVTQESECPRLPQNLRSSCVKYIRETKR